MRATDAALAIPRLFLLLLLAALFRPSLGTTIVLVGSTTWMAAARLVRGETMAIRGREFVAAAQAAGASPSRVAFRHVLPHAGAVLAVEAALRLGQAVLLEASLSFLGLGIPPPTASWGGLIADGRDRLLDAWWIATWPGLALAGVVIAASLVADGARERL
jgi:peptide/nickel transport system permease protein